MSKFYVALDDRQPKHHQHYIRIILIGDTNVGKTSLLLRFVDGVFEKKPPTTIGIDLMCKTLELKSENYIKLAIFDTAGQERFRSIGPHYYRCAHGAMIVFDVTNPVSFDSVRYWADAIRKHSQAAAKIPLILVGNKSDLLEKRMIMPSEAAQLANRIGAKYFEASAASGSGVSTAFSDLAEQAFDLHVARNQHEISFKFQKRQSSLSPQHNARCDCI